MNETINVFDRLRAQINVELFYDISIRDKEISLQGHYSPDAVKSINARLETGNGWKINDNGHCVLVSSFEDCRVKVCLA